MPKLTRLLIIVALALTGAFASAQVFVPSAGAAFTDGDGDGVADIAEQVFGSNANAAGSTPETSGAPIILTTNVCANGLDDDGDGTADAADAGCADADDDLFSDQVELQFGSDPDDSEYYPEDSHLDNALISSGLPIRFCADGDDNDDDGLEDGADPGCTDIDGDSDDFSDLVEKDLGSDPADSTSVPEHRTVNAGSCADGTDNDDDGDVDGADDGCVLLSNDDVEDALEFDALPFSHTTKLLNATVQPSERNSGCVIEEQSNTVWYKFVAGQSGSVVIDATESDFTPIVSVWAETTFGMTEVACANGFGYYRLGSQARMSFQTEAGRTYFIQVGSQDPFYLASGRLVLTASAGMPPANDDRPAAVNIGQLPYSATVDTIAATTEAAEPVPSCVSGGADVRSTVWYSYTAGNDGHIIMDTNGTEFLTSMMAAYRRGGDGSLAQVACSFAFPYFLVGEEQRVAFTVEAGETYLIQAGGFFYNDDDGGPSGAAGPGAPAGFAFGGSKGVLTLHVQSFTPPTCPTPQYTILDPAGDASGGPGADIERMAATVSGGNLCVDLDMRDPVDPGLVQALVSIDTDMDRDTGYDDIQYDCNYPTGLGVDTNGSYRPETGLLMPVVTSGGNGFPFDLEYGVARFDNGAFHLALPMGALGGDSLRFVASVVQVGEFDFDCAPNGGNMTCQNGSCSFSPFRNGDANCATGANAIDAAIVLQYGAGLLSTLLCQDAADVDGNEVIDSRDAALILQYTAGLIPQLPPFLFIEG